MIVMSETDQLRPGAMNPDQIKRLLHLYRLLSRALQAWYPASSGAGMPLAKPEGVSKPTERIAIIRAEADALLSLIEWAIKGLSMEDRALVRTYYIEGNSWRWSARKHRLSRGQFYRRLDAIAAQLAKDLEGVERAAWRHYRRTARMLLL